MTLFEEIKNLLHKIDYMPYMETVEDDWCIYNENEVYYTYKGEVYSGYIKEGVYDQDGCTFINVDNGCGDTITRVFQDCKKLTQEDFEENYGDDM